MWKVRLFCFCICTVCPLSITCAETETAYEGGNFIFDVAYPPEYVENSKYFGRSDTLFFDKLVQTNESNIWIRRGRFALFDNTSACILTAAIFNLTVEDSGSYRFAVDVKMWPDPDFEMQLTVMRGKPEELPIKRPTKTITTRSITTPAPQVVFQSSVSPFNETTQKSGSYPRFVAVLSLVCVFTVLIVCPFSLFKWANTCRLSVSVSFRTRKTSTHIIDEYVKMSPIIQSDKSLAVEGFHRSINTETAAHTDVDQIYTEMNPTFVQESVYQSLDQTTE